MSIAIESPPSLYIIWNLQTSLVTQRYPWGYCERKRRQTHPKDIWNPGLWILSARSPGWGDPILLQREWRDRLLWILGWIKWENPILSFPRKRTSEDCRSGISPLPQRQTHLYGPCKRNAPLGGNPSRPKNRRNRVLIQKVPKYLLVSRAIRKCARDSDRVELLFRNI